MQEKKKKSSIGNSKGISYRDKKKPKIEQENKGKMLDTFRESQDKYGSHLEEPLGLIRPEGYHQILCVSCLLVGEMVVSKARCHLEKNLDLKATK